MPAISVIVPVYKVEPYICRCIDSILAQTFTDFELILIDDGSPDNCGKICDEYASREQRITVIHQKNGGLSAARNAGIDWAFEYSDSQWLSFVDSDDWIHPEMLEKLFEAVIQNGVDLSSCGYEKTELELPKLEKERLNVKQMDSETFYRNYGVNATVAWGKLYKKECFENLRYPVGKLHEDEFTTYKIIFGCESVVMIEAPLYAYYVNQKSIMNQWNPKRLDSMEAIQERILFFKNRGLVTLQHEQEKAYIWNIVNHLKSIEQCDQGVRIQYESFLRGILRKELRKQRREIPFNENKWFYEVAYPKMMRLYWILLKYLKRYSEVIVRKREDE